MAIKLPQGLEITSKQPVDTRLVLSKERMRSINDGVMPSNYFTICSDDGKLYLYNKNNPVDESTGKFRVLQADEKRNAYDSIEKVKDYLYEVKYSELDYEFANNWFKNGNAAISRGACSSVRKDNWYCRHYDWNYNHDVDFIIRTPRLNGRYATVGLGGCDPSLKEDFVSTFAYSDSYKIVPFKLLDGINEYGVFANTNVVPNQKGETTGTIPIEEQKLELCNLMIPRFVLDNFKTAQEAIDYIRNYVSIYSYSPLVTNFKEDIHVMIGDENKTFVMEFVDNQIVVNEFPIMTNFFIDGVDFNEDGSVYTPEDHDFDDTKSAISVNHITSHGQGLERFNILNAGFNSIVDKQSARELMDKVYYTGAYTSRDPIWYSECVGDMGVHGDYTLDSRLSSLNQIWNVMRGQYADRSRDTAETWHTVHSCIYDLKNRKIYFIAQEDGKEIEVDFNYYTKEQVDRLFVKKEELSTEIPNALKKALSEQTDKDSGLIVDENGNIKVNLNNEHLEIIDNKIDLAISCIQAIESN